MFMRTTPPADGPHESGRHPEAWQERHLRKGSPQANSPQARPGRMKIGILSAGKVGVVLGAALRGAGHEIIGAYAASEASQDRLDAMLPGVPALPIEEVVARAQMVLLALPDDDLEAMVSGLAELGLWRPGQLLVHVAGRFGTGVLDAAATAGALTVAVHPAMTFTGTSLDIKRLLGCPFAVTAPPVLLPIAQALVAEIGGEPFTVEEEDRPAYHAALTHGANHLVTLVTQAKRLLETVGIEDSSQYLRPLLTAALEGALSSGEAGLTGPVVRGDAETITEHLHALDALNKTAACNSPAGAGAPAAPSSTPAAQASEGKPAAPSDSAGETAATSAAKEVAGVASPASYADIPPVYRALCRATTDRAEARRVLRPEAAQRIRELLGEE
ncbi:Rossmann-like and DUF2520 domain-containing protein [Actinobaculum suis]